MNTNTVMVGIALYLLLGIILLSIFDMATRRIRTQLSRVTVETQSTIASTGNYVSNRVATVVFIGAMWIFWPMVFLGIFVGGKGKSHGA